MCAFNSEILPVAYDPILNIILLLTCFNYIAYNDVCLCKIWRKRKNLKTKTLMILMTGDGDRDRVHSQKNEVKKKSLNFKENFALKIMPKTRNFSWLLNQ